MKFKNRKKENIINNYLRHGSWRIKENANQIYCVGHMMNYTSATNIKDYWLNHVFNAEACEAHNSGRIHIHDLSRLTPYCVGFSTLEIIKNGLKGPKGRINSIPPKHLSSAINQLVNFVGVMSQEFAGAIALNDFSLYLAPFVYYDKLSYKDIKQKIQEFGFHLNQPNRWAGECPFTNITINLTVPVDLKDTQIIIGGEQRKKTYKEFEKEMNLINRAILEVLIEGDATGTPLTFPVLTVGIDKNFPWESEIAKQIFQVTAKYGTPFFENFKEETGRDTETMRSLCCRLSLRTDELKKHSGGIFGNADSMGSASVVTINLNRIGYLAKNKKEYFKILDKELEIVKDILNTRRKKINEMFKMNLYPYTKLYLKNYNNFFSTIGLIGGNESMLNFMNKNLMDSDAIDFMKEVLDYTNNKCKIFQKDSGNLFNVEAVPGEGAAYSLARKDRKNYPNIILAGEKEVFLTNSTLPSVEETNFVSLIKTQEKLQTQYTGGTTLNIYLGEKLNDYRQAKNMVKTIIKNTNIPYFSITPVYSLCPIHGYIDGEKYRCPICNKTTEVFSRVVGYLKPKQQYNKGKIEEFRIRKYFQIKDIDVLVNEKISN